MSMVALSLKEHCSISLQALHAPDVYINFVYAGIIRPYVVVRRTPHHN